MEKMIRALLAGVAVLVIGCQACSDSATGTMGTVADAPKSNADAAAEPDQLDAEVDATVDTETDAVDSADAATNGGAAADVADAAGSMEAVCGAALPVPGQPCSKVGELRCTNLGASTQLNTIWRCIRPNSVRCVDSNPPGSPMWSLEPCPAPGKDCLTYWGFTCASGASGDKCVLRALPLDAINLVPSSPFFQTSPICEGHEGMEFCAGYHTPNRCTTLDKLPAPVANEIKRVMGPCASYLSDVPYFYPSELCSLDYIYCKTIDGSGVKPPQSVPTSLNKCYIDTKTGQPHCAKTCAEAGAIEVW
ncbi:MAG: hypothetical protein HY902_16835 [Deltaproteobacteria bacterium]|nr:hypothetical protein [Deltaproteobacteria bacterium]